MPITEVVRLKENSIDEGILLRAGQIIKKGGLVAFPTETVYGLGGDALQKESSKRIYEAKGRPSDNPLIVHICDFGDIEHIAKNIPKEARMLGEIFWPGPLTMILEKSDIVPYETTGGLNTVAVRMPLNKIALGLIKAAGGFVAAPSANTSGRPSPTSARHVEEDLKGKIDMILDGGDAEIGLESTIVDLTGPAPMILRPGFVTQDDLSTALSQSVQIDKALYPEGSQMRPKAPGMKYRHYAPKGEMAIVTGEPSAVIKKINELSMDKMKNGAKVGVICSDETLEGYLADCVKSVGKKNDRFIAAHRLYSILREFDEEGVDYIYSEAFADEGIGQALMNRLMKAAGHNVINA